MLTSYLVLWNWTEQGVRNFKDSSTRVEEFEQLVKRNGGKLNQFMYTLGAYDGAILVEAPSDEAFLNIALNLASLGNVRTTTMKAWSVPEMINIIGQH